MPREFNVTTRDLSGYQSFSVCSENGDRCTIMVSGKLYPDGDRKRYGIHLVIWGDYGPFENWWSHAGSEGTTWWGWLEDTDQDYFLKKLTNGNHREFDGPATLKNAKAQLLQLRKEGSIGPTTARQGWDDLCEADETASKEHIIGLIGDIAHLPDGVSRVPVRQHIVFDDYWEMDMDRLKPNLKGFWEGIWRPFIEQAKRTEGFTKPDLEVQPVAEAV